MNQSSIFSINWKDFAKSLIVAFLTVFIKAIIVIVDNGALPTVAELLAAGKLALVALLAYLLKNFLTNSSGEILKTQKPATLPYSPRSDL